MRFDEVDVDEAKAALAKMDASIAKARKVVTDKFGLPVPRVKDIANGWLTRCTVCGDRAVGCKMSGGSECHACHKGGYW